MLELKAQPRKELGKKTNKHRKAGLMPAVIYGHGIKSQPIFVPASDFLKAYKQTGESALLVLELDGKKNNVLIHDTVKDPISESIIHADFYQVRMDEKIKTQVQLVFIGESDAVKSEAGVLVKNIQEVEVEALPKDLPHHIDVDISGLRTFQDRILIKDLSVADGVKITADSEEIVASVMPPRSEEELAALEQKAEVSPEEVKVVGEEEKAAAEAEAQMPEGVSEKK